VEGRGGLPTGGWLEKDTAESAEGRILGQEPRIEPRLPAPKRHRFGGEYPYRTWPQEIDLEVPRLSYAPPRNQTKPWPRKAQMEKLVPACGGERIVSTARCNESSRVRTRVGGCPAFAPPPEGAARNETVLSRGPPVATGERRRSAESQAKGRDLSCTPALWKRPISRHR
jgi:hypothetical protein